MERMYSAGSAQYWGAVLAATLGADLARVFGECLLLEDSSLAPLAFCHLLEDAVRRRTGKDDSRRRAWRRAAAEGRRRTSCLRCGRERTRGVCSSIGGDMSTEADISCRSWLRAWKRQKKRGGRWRQQLEALN